MRRMPISGAWTEGTESVPLISMRGVTKSFARGLARASRRTLAVAGIDLDVFPRDVVLVTGDEGAGKTTLLQCACGILRPDRGSVHFNAPGYVPAVPVYYPFLTVRDVLSLRGASRQSADALLLAFDIATFADGVVAELSSAALQRLAIAESLVGAPSVVLIDTGAFGVPACSTISAAAASGAAVVVAVRNGSTLARVATRIVCLEQGRVTRILSASRSLVAERMH